MSINLTLLDSVGVSLSYADADNISRIVRNKRQEHFNELVASCFGRRFLNLKSRSERVLEEAIELAQASDYPREMMHALVDKICDREKGEIYQEIGGVSVSLLSYAGVAKLSADWCEAEEIRRVEEKPVEYFQQRLKEKIAAGICSEPDAEVA